MDFVKESSLPTASPQVEASDKFQSNYELEIGSAAIRTFAVWVAASNQVLDDLAELRDWIDQALLYALLVKEEAEILSGDNTGQHLNGLITQASSYQGTYDRSGDNAMDRLRNALAELEAGDEQPNFIAVSPVDWRTRIQAVKDESGGANTGRYLAQDPVTRSLIASPTLWGIPVVVSNSLSAGTFLVGDSMQAYVADRMDANVVLSTEHSDYFVKNLVAIRAEERLALVVRRPSAFLTGTLTDTSPL